MKKNYRAFFILFAMAVTLTVTSAEAARSPGGFTVSNISGEALAREPGAPEFTPAEVNRAYAWGTRLQTKANAEVTVALTQDGSARIMANATVSIERDRHPSPRLRVVVENGMVHLDVKDSFHQTQSLAVETATLICTPSGTRFSVGVGQQPDVTMTVITVTDGKVAVEGKHHPVQLFNIPELKAGEQASIAVAANRTWFRIKNHKGDFYIEVPGEDSEPRLVKLSPDQMIRVVIAPSETDPNLFHITVIIIDADGETPVEAWTTQMRSKPDLSGTIDPFEPSEPSVPTTTTTTIPSPTPVGDR